MSKTTEPARDSFDAADDVVERALLQDEAADLKPVASGWQTVLGRFAGSRVLATLAVVILLFVFFTIGNPNYASANILIGIARRITPIGIMAVGMTFLLISGELDLSIGAIFGFCSVLMGQLASEQQWDPWLAMGIVILVGLFIGMLNGTLVTRIGLPSFIATLGMLAALRGASNAVSAGVGTYAKNVEQPFYEFFNGNFMDTRIPNMFLVMLVVTAIGSVILATTKFGSDVYSTGGNADAARNNGIATRRVKFICFMFTGALCGLAGAMQFAYLQYVPGNTGVGFELQVIAAVIIGGVGLFGGRGTVIGGLLGAIILAELTSGLVMIGVKDYWDGVAAGIVIVVAVALDTLLRRGAAHSLTRTMRVGA
jgi:ribose transport system permease protein